MLPKLMPRCPDECHRTYPTKTCSKGMCVWYVVCLVCVVCVVMWWMCYLVCSVLCTCMWCIGYVVCVACSVRGSVYDMWRGMHKCALAAALRLEPAGPLSWGSGLLSRSLAAGVGRLTMSRHSHPHSGGLVPR